jgi:DNA-binding MarR family transcriptional regulator
MDLIYSPQDESVAASPPDETILWLEVVLPSIMRRLMGSEDMDTTLAQLPLAQLRLLQALYQDQGAPSPPEGNTMGRLSERLHVRQNALTQAADRLVHNGLAERCSDPSDRRVVRLRLTETGRAWMQARRQRRRGHIARLLDCLSEADRSAFLQSVRVLEAASERLAASNEAPAGSNPYAVKEAASALMADAADERDGAAAPRFSAQHSVRRKERD